MRALRMRHVCCCFCPSAVCLEGNGGIEKGWNYNSLVVKEQKLTQEFWWLEQRGKGRVLTWCDIVMDPVPQLPSKDICPQRPSRLLGTGRPRRLSRSSWALKNMSTFFCLSRDPLLTCANKSGAARLHKSNTAKRVSPLDKYWTALAFFFFFFLSSIKGKSSLSFLLKGNRTENVSLARKRRKSANILSRSFTSNFFSNVYTREVHLFLASNLISRGHVGSLFTNKEQKTADCAWHILFFWRTFRPCLWRHWCRLPCRKRQHAGSCFCVFFPPSRARLSNVDCFNKQDEKSTVKPMCNFFFKKIQKILSIGSVLLLMFSSPLKLSGPYHR